MMHILIAPNAFKNSLTAEAAAEAIREGFDQSALNCTTECFPIADGGDGTAGLIISKLSGSIVPVTVQDPLGRMIDATFGLVDNGLTAVIEMADASGLRLLKQDELDPLSATTYGTGQMIIKALDMGVKKIVIAMGGSATVDGGIGILSALGIKFMGDKTELNDLPKNLSGLTSVDISGLDARISNCEIIVLCDVDNKLLGDAGAAAVFGPQKGATPDEVKLLDEGLTQLSNVALKELGKDMAIIKYGGAAGGASAGVYAYLNAKLVNGIDYFMDITGFDDALAKANLVITGEGSIDEQTLQGKGPFGVASRAKAKNIPVIGIAGKIPLQSNEKLHRYFKVLLAIGNEPTDTPAALNRTEENLTRTAIQIGQLIKMSGS
ncbi:glycerate kinase [Mucilaginibacter sp.]|jgi:glycerate kinase|uniref:glycerate kinase n=1 Tax=Mucilaginibacter sp. TaxID=1882438 RepID=UPI003567C560